MNRVLGVDALRAQGRAAAVERSAPDPLADFDRLYALHARYIAGVVHRLMGTDGELEDIVQETFVDALHGLTRLEDPNAVRAWLVTVAVRRTRRLLTKRRRRMIFAFGLLDASPTSSDPRAGSSVDDLYDALGRLPTDLRLPWSLHRIERLSIPETAAACEVSAATVKRRIADAEERLTRRLGTQVGLRETSEPSDATDTQTTEEAS